MVNTDNFSEKSSLIIMGIRKENQHEKLLLPLHEDDKKVENNEKLLPPPAKRKVEKMWKKYLHKRILPL